MSSQENLASLIVPRATFGPVLSSIHKAGGKIRSAVLAGESYKLSVEFPDGVDVETWYRESGLSK